MLRTILICFMLTAAPTLARADDKCPDPIAQVATDVKGKIDGQVNTFLKLGNVKAVGDIDTITTDVLHSYPNADHLAIVQNTLSILCNKILPSPDYSNEFKQQIILRMLNTLGDVKPNPLEDMEKLIPPGRSSKDFVRSILGVPRTSDDNMDVFARNEILIAVAYYTNTDKNRDIPGNNVQKNIIRRVSIGIDPYSPEDGTTPVKWRGSSIFFRKTKVRDVFGDKPYKTSCVLGTYRLEFPDDDIFYLECFGRVFFYVPKEQATALRQLVALHKVIGYCDPQRLTQIPTVTAELAKFGYDQVGPDGCFDPMFATDFIEEKMINACLDFSIYAVDFDDYFHNGDYNEFDINFFPFH